MSDNSITRCKLFSENEIRKLTGVLKNNDCTFSGTIVVVGSLGRLEAHEESDVDCFAIVDTRDLSEPEIESHVKLAEKALNQLKVSGLRVCATDGAFGCVVKIDDFLGGIAGINESNHSFTRRILFISESRPLYGELFYNFLMEQFLAHYIEDNITNHQIALYMFNDIARYYRTLCTDFEFKTNIGGKNWGIRNLKLVFSRKLLFFSLIVSIGKTFKVDAAKKREILRSYLNLSPIDRIQAALDNYEKHKTIFDEIVRIYSIYLESMSDNSLRDKYLATNKTDRTPEYIQMKEQGSLFSQKLAELFYSVFDNTETHDGSLNGKPNPIRVCVLF